MKHEVKITLILLSMFLVTQLIGIVIIDAYSPKITAALVNGTVTNVSISEQIPYGMQPPEIKPQVSLASITVSIIIAVFILFLLMKLKLSRQTIEALGRFVLLVTDSLKLINYELSKLCL